MEEEEQRHSLLLQSVNTLDDLPSALETPGHVHNVLFVQNNVMRIRDRDLMCAAGVVADLERATTERITVLEFWAPWNASVARYSHTRDIGS